MRIKRLCEPLIWLMPIGAGEHHRGEQSGRHRQLATTSDKLTSERSERADNVISIFRKHSLVVNRLHGYQKGLYLTLLRPSCTQ